jgi:tetratricopeptide (TPR) repeat protein
LDAYAIGDYATAANWFDEAFNRDTTYLRALMLAWTASRNAGNQSRADSLEAFLRAHREDLARYDRYRLDWMDAQARGEHGAALAIARRGVELNPFGTLRIGLALSLRNTNRPAAARGEFEEWLVASSEVALWYGIWTNYCGLLHTLGDYEEERSVARRERENLPAGELPLREAEARALAALGDLETFHRRLVELEALGSEGLALGQAYLRLALELRAHGHAEASRELSERALGWYAGLPEEMRSGRPARLLRSDLLYVDERWADAEEISTALVEGADGADLMEAIGRLGAAAARLGDTAGAEAALHQLDALAAIPGAPPGRATLLRARIVSLQGERERAVELLRQAFAGGQAFGIWLHRDMDLEPLRGYPRYEQLVAPAG